MWVTKSTLISSYNEELKKQKEPYEYYIGHKECVDVKKTTNRDEGEHENVPFICVREEEIEKFSEDDNYIIYEYGDYFLYESKKGFSSSGERAELLTEGVMLNADLIYSDIDHSTCDGKRHHPFFKTNYYVDSFRSRDYITDFYAIKKKNSRRDFETLEKISHVTKVLFHYNCEDNEEDINNLHGIDNKSSKTDEFYLQSLDADATNDKVSVIIPSKDNPKLVKTVIEGIINAKIKSKFNEIEVVLIDNGSTEDNQKEISRVIESVSTQLTVKYIYEPAEFNFSAMCNRGVSESDGDYLLFLNDDIEITDELFILKLLYYAKMDHVGAVGAKLLYPGEEKRIQHTGITCLKYPGPSHKLSTFPDVKPLYFGRNLGVHNCLAVTGACLMVSREKYFKIGGFHDKMKVGYNDVDLCVALYEQGYQNLVNNDCVLIHHESITRGADSVSDEKLNRLDAERNLLYERHPWLLTDGDPYYNSNLAEDFLDYRVNVIPDFEKRDYFSKANGDLVKYVKTDATPSKGLFMNIESKVRNRNYYEVRGWALINKKDNYLYDTYLTIVDSDGQTRVYDTAPVRREDLSSVFPEARYTELSGFFARIETTPQKLGVLLINKQTGKKYYAGFTESDI